MNQKMKNLTTHPTVIIWIIIKTKIVVFHLTMIYVIEGTEDIIYVVIFCKEFKLIQN